jgi:HD-like signal output (HDOD) protein
MRGFFHGPVPGDAGEGSSPAATRPKCSDAVPSPALVDDKKARAMIGLWAGVSILVAVVLLWALQRNKGQPPAGDKPAPVPPAPRPTAPPQAAPQIQARVAPTPATDAPLPPELAAFEWRQPQALSAQQRESLTSAFQGIPRPPRLMQRLASPDFVNNATSAQLAELVVGEPLIAAKVLAMVNSPLFGLQAPVGSLGQAITFLGLNSVRNLCLQYLMVNAFKVDGPERQRLIDQTWNASLVASELAQRLVLKRKLPDPGSLVTAVVLSFLGRLATISVMPASALHQLPAQGFLARSDAEQRHFGLSAGQIGGLLMQSWSLPDSIVQEVLAIDHVLVWDTPLHTPATPDNTARLRSTLAYVCARLGEQWANGEWPDLGQLDLATLAGPDWHHAATALRHPTLARTSEFLQSAEVQMPLQKMMRGLR